MGLLLFGVLAIPVAVHVPVVWLFERLAVRAAYGPDGADVTVVRVTKPSTVTFSDGRSADVGPTPAVVSTLVQVAACIPLVGCYVFAVRRYGPAWARTGNLNP